MGGPGVMVPEIWDEQPLPCHPMINHQLSMDRPLNRCILTKARRGLRRSPWVTGKQRCSPQGSAWNTGPPPPSFRSPVRVVPLPL